METWKIVVLACAVIVFVSVILFDDRDAKRVDDCVLVRPLEANTGSISSSGLVFHVDYVGTTKETGQSCSVRSLVTVFEYDRMMHKRETDEK